MAPNKGWLMLCLATAWMLHAQATLPRPKVPRPLHRRIALKEDPPAPQEDLRLVPRNAGPAQPRALPPGLTPGCRF